MPNWNEVLLGNYGTPELILENAEGSLVWDQFGKQYHDLLGGIAVHLVGHANPRLVNAARDQMAKLWHVSNLYQSVPAVELAHEIQTRGGGGKVFLCNSGTEANEAALKAIRKHGSNNGRGDAPIIAFEGSFHGRTLGALSLTGRSAYRQGFGQLPGPVLHVNPFDVEAVEATLKLKPLGFFFEPILGEGGVKPLPKGTVSALKSAQKEGALLACDSIQAGMYRTGHFTAAEPLGIRPDVVTFAKALGGGLPIGATLFSKQLEDTLKQGDHGTTFGGNPISCAVSLEVLKIIDDESLALRAPKVYQELDLALRRGGYVSRGAGAMVGADVKDRNVLKKWLQDQGFLIGVAGDDAIRLTPALNIPLDSIRSFGDALEEYSTAHSPSVL